MSEDGPLASDDVYWKFSGEFVHELNTEAGEPVNEAVRGRDVRPKWTRENDVSRLQGGTTGTFRVEVDGDNQARGK